MKTLIFLAVAIGVAQAFSVVIEPQDEDWEAFKPQGKHGKRYANEVEEKFRKMIFRENLEQIDMHNKGIRTYKLGINKFSDMLSTEVTRIVNGYKPSQKNLTARVPMPASFLELRKHVPDHMDWRDKGAVTPVKDQGFTCGSCWTFSATGALEGQNFMKTGKLVSLSEQNLLDCARGIMYDSEGCHGGDAEEAFQYISDNRGIDTEDSYPYQGTDDNPCRYQPSNKGADDSGYSVVSEGDEEKLKHAVAKIGPISVAIDARKLSPYESGIFVHEHCSTVKLTHAVLVVGYGTDDGNDYWLVKNSWGENWGEKGYFRMARNNNNMCGITNKASYPIVN